MHSMQQLPMDDIIYVHLLTITVLTWWILYRQSATTCEHHEGWLLQVHVQEEILLRSNTTATLKFPFACCKPWGGITEALRWNPAIWGIINILQSILIHQIFLQILHGSTLTINKQIYHMTKTLCIPICKTSLTDFVLYRCSPFWNSSALPLAKQEYSLREKTTISISQ